jgi:hypothetical protein
MSDINIVKFYRPEVFTSLPAGSVISEGLLRTWLSALVLSTPIGLLEVLAVGLGVRITWDTLPSESDLAAILARVGLFTGGATTSAPFEYNSFAVSTSTVGTPTIKLDNTTPALDAGTYQVLWTTSTRMQAVIANTGVQADITLTRSDGVNVHQDDAWSLSNRHAFNGAITFQVLAGQTIRSLLTFQRLGASGTAELSGARITVDKIS